MSDPEYKTRQNMIMKFKLSLKDLTIELHSISSLDKKAKAADNEDLLGFDDPGYEQQNSKWENTDNMFHEQAQLKKETDAMGTEIDRLAENVTVLNKMFKQMHEMIFEQGTIVDRIDYNIEQASEKVRAGTKKLVKAKEHQDNTCANKVIFCEMVTIFALFLI